MTLDAKRTGEECPAIQNHQIQEAREKGGKLTVMINDDLETIGRMKSTKSEAPEKQIYP